MRKAIVRGLMPWRTLALWLRFGAVVALAGGVLGAAATAGHGTGAGSPRLAAAVTDPSGSGQWGSLASWPLVAVHAALLPSGNVVVWDAWETGGTPSVRVWNPSTQAFTSAPNTTTQIFCSAHLLLPNGKLLVVGGHNGGEYGINSTQLFDPATNTWSAGPNMSYARWYPSATMLGDGRVVAISGHITPTAYADTPEIYSPTTSSWAKLSSVNTSFVHDDGYPMTYLLPSGKLVVFDPEGGNVRLIDPNTQAVSTEPSSPVKFGSVAMYAPGKFVVSGGGSDWSTPTQGTTAVIDMNQPSPTWTVTSPMTYGRYQHNLQMLADGEVMAVGGSDAVDQADLNGPLPTEIWNPQTQAWTETAALSNPRMYHSTTLLLPDGRVLAMGGGRWSTAKDYPTSEIYSPPYLFKGARPAITSAPASSGYAGTMAVQAPDAASIASVALVDLGSNTHTSDLSQRYVPLKFTAGSGVLSVQAPVSTSLAPPGTYMLFLVNGSGVPSVASLVQLVSTPDSQPPSVTISSPPAGASVSGVVQVAASATDNVGVAGVQLQVDGTALGAPITYPPYAAGLDTTTLPNGAHTLTAKAWDAAGNVATSSPVSVTVANATTPPAISGVAAGSITSVSATVAWTTDKASDTQVDFGTTTAYGSSTVLDPTLVTQHSQALSGLTGNTLYHYRVKSKDVSGDLAVSGDSTFSTSGPPPSFRSRSSVTNGTTVATPAGVAAGDLLLASLEVDGGSVSVSGPTGWTRLLDTPAATGTSQAFHAQAWYRVAAAGEPSSYTWSVSGSSWTDVGIVDYTGVNPTSPVDAAAGLDAGGATSATTPSVTATVPGDMVVASFVNFNGGTWTAGSGMTARNNFDGNFSEDAAQIAAGATGARGATSNTSGATSAQVVALRPLQTDTVPPTVTVTAPAGGSTVSGTAVGLSATASDNVGVSWVQFQLDGANLGSQLASPPYQLSWDTTQASNGSHTLTARASDAAGNLAVSPPVTVTVSNAPPPVISNVAANGISTAGAGVSWTTDVASSSQVDYGTTAAYGSSTALDPTQVTSHAQTLGGLQPGTLYHYRVRSGATGGSLALSGDLTFSTAVPPAPAISNVAAGSITSSGASISWATDTASDTTVAYGTTASYGQSASSAGLVTSHSQALSGLSPSTTYHYQVQSKDAYGQVSTAGDFSFTTTAASATPPSFRSRSTVTDGTTVSKPSGAAAGDLLLASLEIDADPATVTGPAGWTQLMDTPAAPGTPSVFHAQIWYKVATASEPSSYTWTVGGSPWVDIGLLDYTNVNTTSPIDVASGRYAGATATPSTSSVTTTGANDMVVSVFMDYNYGTWTPGTGTTKRYDFDSNEAQDQVQAAAGSTGAKTATDTSSGPSTAQIIALRSK